MSADNWAVCPRCFDNAKLAAAAKLQAAADAYGKVPSDEYERLIAEARVPVEPDPFQTFREDYEFYGVADGEITATYSGHCQVCNLGLDFTHKRHFYDRAV